MSPTELRDPVYLRAWCIDQATMVVGRENVRGEMIVELAKVLEEAMIEVIQRAPRPL
ncbi:hypothetical protein [Acetobacter sp.]|uniref:hypothetical protein n=1 Tax=Acetobacter sp. TaxID=440 RepID=UPI0039EBD8AA